jgi:hypothetical protein
LRRAPYDSNFGSAELERSNESSRSPPCGRENRAIARVLILLLWQIFSGTGFPNQFFCHSWVVGFWRGRPWLAGHRIRRRTWTLARAISGSAGPQGAATEPVIPAAENLHKKEQLQHILEAYSWKRSAGTTEPPCRSRSLLHPHSGGDMRLISMAHGLGISPRAAGGACRNPDHYNRQHWGCRRASQGWAAAT